MHLFFINNYFFWMLCINKYWNNTHKNIILFTSFIILNDFYQHYPFHKKNPSIQHHNLHHTAQSSDCMLRYVYSVQYMSRYNTDHASHEHSHCHTDQSRDCIVECLYSVQGIVVHNPSRRFHYRMLLIKKHSYYKFLYLYDI